MWFAIFSAMSADPYVSSPGQSLRQAQSLSGAFSKPDLRSALGRFATGVTVVTAAGDRGEPIGLTVNSFSSVSLDPPLVLWSLRSESRVARFFASGRAFSVHVLRAEQQALARHFAASEADRFAGVRWQPGEEDVPHLQDVLARFDCRTSVIHPAGDHMILLGEVEGYCSHHGEPLVFALGAFRTLDPN
jgi:flavin reductase (DIM6/NTAB) family NADH-FMN oxidoreductase RutF